MRLVDIFESDDMRDFFKQLQANDPRFKNLRIRGDADHDELRKQDQMAVQARRDQEATQAQVKAQAQIDQDRDQLPALRQQLAQMKAKFDPNFEYSDDHSFWSQQNNLRQSIHGLERRIKAAEA